MFATFVGTITGFLANCYKEINFKLHFAEENSFKLRSKPLKGLSAVLQYFQLKIRFIIF
jgi:hypothetical protein